MKYSSCQPDHYEARRLLLFAFTMVMWFSVANPLDDDGIYQWVLTGFVVQWFEHTDEDSAGA
jgi:hypothetical protein